jgi:hypothetical protein
MSRNSLYLIIGLLALAALIAGYLYYQEQQNTDSIKIKVGEGSITIETK